MSASFTHLASIRPWPGSKRHAALPWLRVGSSKPGEHQPAFALQSRTVALLIPYRQPPEAEGSMCDTLCSTLYTWRIYNLLETPQRTCEP